MARVPLVLVHGVPETAAIWEPMLAELAHTNVIPLSPPGFGAPVPQGFSPTADAYLAWLIDCLERIGGPVDLIGHDWGGIHVQRLATARPDLIRSWGTDVAGGADPRYVWHERAQTWQTPGRGEEAIAALSSVPTDQRIEGLMKSGMTATAAKSCVLAAGPDMGRCILGLYRSAVQPALTHWGAEVATPSLRPVLVINATEDLYVGGPALAHAVATGGERRRLCWTD
jgi:pimeloyl-ACP methyl ester carboxylesterase